MIYRTRKRWPAVAAERRFVIPSSAHDRYITAEEGQQGEGEGQWHPDHHQRDADPDRVDQAIGVTPRR